MTGPVEVCGHKAPHGVHSGVKLGEFIVGVEGQDIQLKSITEISALIRGEPGTHVSILLRNSSCVQGQEGEASSQPMSGSTSTSLASTPGNPPRYWSSSSPSVNGKHSTSITDRSASDDMSTIIVELTRGMDGAVGLAFFRKSATSSRYVVTACKANGAAAKSGELAGGDEILKVDATFTDGLPVEHVTSLLRGAPDSKVILTIFRPLQVSVAASIHSLLPSPQPDSIGFSSFSSAHSTRTLVRPTSMGSSSFLSAQSPPSNSEPSRVPSARPVGMSSFLFPAPQPPANANPTFVTPTIVTVVLTRSMDGTLGLAITRHRGEQSYRVTWCMEHGAAETSGELVVGDEILQIDDTPIIGNDVHDGLVAALLRGTPGTQVRLKLCRVPSVMSQDTGLSI